VSPSHFLLLLGMEHSGAGLLAACLRACGLWLGPAAGEDERGARGSQELALASGLHRAILADSGGSRLRPPLAVRARPEQRRGIRELVELLGERAPSGVKDPLLLVVLHEWLAAAPGASCVASFRHPLAVARALAERDGLPLAQGVDLWLRYNDALASEHRRRPFPLLAFDLDDRARYRRTLCAAAGELALVPDETAVAALIDAEPWHGAGPGAVPARCEPVYEYLREQRVRA